MINNICIMQQAMVFYFINSNGPLQIDKDFGGKDRLRHLMHLLEAELIFSGDKYRKGMGKGWLVPSSFAGFILTCLEDLLHTVDNNINRSLP